MIYLSGFNFNPFVFFFPLFLVGMDYDSKAQESQPAVIQQQNVYSHVQWLNNWPSIGNEHHRKQMKDYINAFLFGIKPPALSNPVSIFASNPDDFWILDKGNKTVFQIKQGVGHIPNLFLRLI